MDKISQGHITIYSKGIECEWVACIEFTLDRVQWRSSVNTVIEFGRIKSKKFLDHFQIRKTENEMRT